MSTESSNQFTRRSFLLFSGLSFSALILLPHRAWATSWSAATTQSIDGVTYTYSSGLDTGLQPKAYTRISSNSALAAGKIKARAVLITAVGSKVLASSSWKSNGAGTSQVTATVTTSHPNLAYCSSGKVSINGTPYNCNKTSSAKSAVNPLPKNTAGLTYGTYADVENDQNPDLLAVISDNGTEGYVFYEHFMNESASDNIPVFNQEGEGPIDTFTFGDK